MDILGQIAKDRAERVKDLHLDLPIPTWDRGLVARFQVLPRVDVERFIERKRSVDSDIDLLIQSCVALYALDAERNVQNAERMEENEDYVRVQDEEGNPVVFSQDLGLRIGMEPEDAERAKHVVLFCFKNNGVAIGGFVGRLITWMQNTDAKVAADLVGE